MVMPAEVVLCDRCRWPYPRPAKCLVAVCPGCRGHEEFALMLVLRRLRLLGALIRDHQGGLTGLRGDPARAARLVAYRARAAARKPLFVSEGL